MRCALSFVKPVLYLSKLLSIFIGIAVLALGIYIQIITNVIINSAEGLVKAIAEKTGNCFGNIKIIFDTTLVAIACLISFLEFGGIRGLREGTFISAVPGGSCNKCLHKNVSC
jgi:uncharacterized membrane protein YczE